MHSDDFKTVGPDIVKSFHEQFSQNQNHHQVLFVQVLAVMVTVLVGFGYVYIRTKGTVTLTQQPAQAIVEATTPKQEFLPPKTAMLKPESAATDKSDKDPRPPSLESKEPETNITIVTLYAFLAMASLLLSFGLALISNMGLGFRRDQMVASNIRVLSYVMVPPNNSEGIQYIDYFPSDFNPVKKRWFFGWMPEFHKIFWITLFLVKIILVISVLWHPQFGRSFFATSGVTDIFLSRMAYIVYGTILVDVLVLIWYWYKWRKTAMGAFARLQ